jgi:hypothetical protein
MIKQILNILNAFHICEISLIISVIRDFWSFSEIS